MNLETINHTILLIIVAIAVVTDWRTKKIPNLLTFPAAACGIILNYLSGSWHGALMAAGAWLLAVIITIILGNLPIGAAKGGGIGMGDVKLLAAIGAFLGPKSALIAIFYFCLCFGLMSCFLLAITVPWKQLAILTSTAVFDGDISGIKIDTSKLDAQRKSTTPIAIALFIATILTIYCREQTLHFFGLS